MRNEAFESALAALDTSSSAHAERAASLLSVYADWLEQQGSLDMAAAMREHRPEDIAPLPLDIETPPDEPFPPGVNGRSFPDITLPLELVVLAQLSPRADVRPVQDRYLHSIDSVTGPRVLAEHRLSLPMDLGAAGIGIGEVTVVLSRLADFDPEALSLQLAQLGVPPENMEGALRCFFASDRAREMERTWRSIHWLVGRVKAPVRVRVGNMPAEDLIADFNDESRMQRTGLFRAVNNHNHPGMLPSGAIVFGAALPSNPARQLGLLRRMGEVARRKSLPLIVGTDLDPCERDWLAREPPLGRHLIMARPSFVLRPAHRFEDRPLEGSAAYLVAARMARAFPKFKGGGGLSGRLLNVDLVGPSGRSRSILAASRGFVELVGRDGHADLVDGATASPSPANSRSLELLLIASRIALQLLNVHFRHLSGATAPELIQDAHRVAATLEHGLRRRLAKVAGLNVSLTNPSFEELPEEGQWGFKGALAVDLRLDLPLASGPERVLHRERMSLRFGP